MMWFIFLEKVQVFAKDASHDLSYEKLAYNLDKIHPRITVKDPKSKLAHFFNWKFIAKKLTYSKHPCCGTNTGSGCCTKESRRTELDTYGVGIALYFQFLKSITWMFFIAGIMSIPAYVLYYSGNASTMQTSNVKNVLTAFSLGNIGQCKWRSLYLTLLQLNTHATVHRWRRWTRVHKGTSLSSAPMAHSTLSRCSDRVSSRKMCHVKTTELTSCTVPHIATTPTSKTRMRPLAITLTVCSLPSAKERSPATSYSTRVHYRAATANLHQTRIRVSTSTSYRQDAKLTQSTSYC